MQVLLHCSHGALTGPLQPALVNSLEVVIAAYSNQYMTPPNQSDSKASSNNTGSALAQDDTESLLRLSMEANSSMVSALQCIHTLMRLVPRDYEEPFRRCGITANIARIVSNPHASTPSAASNVLLLTAQTDVKATTVSPATSSLGQTQSLQIDSCGTYQQDYALYLINRFFGGHQNARAMTQTGMLVRSQLAAIRDLLACSEPENNDNMFDDNCPPALAPNHKILRACEDLSALLRCPNGIYAEEMIDSGVPCALLEALQHSPRETREAVLTVFANDTHAREALVCVLRQSVDKLPFEDSKLLPWLLPTNTNSLQIMPGGGGGGGGGGGSSMYMNSITDTLSGAGGTGLLRQWITLRLERAPGCTDLPNVTGAEIRIEPLAFTHSLRTTIVDMLNKASRSSSNPRNQDRDERHHELRAMMQAFGDDPDGTPLTLLEHIKQFMDHDQRISETTLTVTRGFSALPSVHQWDKDMTTTSVSGAAKKELVLTGLAARNAFSSGGGSSSSAAAASNTAVTTTSGASGGARNNNNTNSGSSVRGSGGGASNNNGSVRANSSIDSTDTEPMAMDLSTPLSEGRASRMSRRLGGAQSSSRTHGYSTRSGMSREICVILILWRNTFFIYAYNNCHTLICPCLADLTVQSRRRAPSDATVVRVLKPWS